MTQVSNTQQIEYWNGPAGERWAALQERIDFGLNAITDGLIEFANPQEGERALDIGCGCGTTTLILAMKLAGSVAGVDISVPMLNVARARAQAQNADIPFVQGDASVHDFQPVFDLVFSRFGVMFFADPVLAFSNIRRAIAPRGRLVFACWRSLSENVWATAPFEAARAFLPAQETPDPHAPGPFAFADGDRLKSILSRAGLRAVTIEKFNGTMNMGQTAEAAAEYSLDIGPLARASAELAETTRSRIKETVARTLAAYATPSGVTPAAACWFVRAQM